MMFRRLDVPAAAAAVVIMIMIINSATTTTTCMIRFIWPSSIGMAQGFGTQRYHLGRSTMLPSSVVYRRISRTRPSSLLPLCLENPTNEPSVEEGQQAQQQEVEDDNLSTIVSTVLSQDNESSSFSSSSSSSNSDSSSIIFSQSQSSSIMVPKIEIHQNVYQSDPGWYKEYVLDVLGEEFCIDRWPVLFNETPTTIAATTTTTTATATSSTATITKLSPNESEEEKEKKEASEQTSGPELMIANVTASDSDEMNTDSVYSDEEGDDNNNMTIGSKEEISSIAEIETDDANDNITDAIDETNIDNNATTSTILSEMNIENKTIVKDYEPSSSLGSESETIESIEVTFDNSQDSDLNFNDKNNTNNEEINDSSNPSISHETPVSTNTENVDKVNIDIDIHDDTNETSSASSSSSKTLVISEQSDKEDNRVVVYRNIVGNTLTYESLANLTALGYSEKEITRIRPDSLSIIVTDRIRNLKMGVPRQWLLPSTMKVTDDSIDQEAPIIVSSVEEAMELVEADQTKQANQRRRRRQRESQSTRRTSVDLMNDEKPSGRRSDKRDTNARDTSIQNSPSQTRRESSVEKQQKWHDQDRRLRESRDRERRRPRPVESNGRNDTTRRRKRVYDSRNPYSNSESLMVEDNDRRYRSRKNGRVSDRNGSDDGYVELYQNDDPVPPKINVPIISSIYPDFGWLDVGTFRKLLRSEAKFRMMVGPEEMAPAIKKEHEWRLNTYRNWLKAIHTGVGESIVPPSRYEREQQERRRQSKSRSAPSPNGPPTRRRMPPPSAEIVEKRLSQAYDEERPLPRRPSSPTSTSQRRMREQQPRPRPPRPPQNPTQRRRRDRVPPPPKR